MSKINCLNPDHKDSEPSMEVYADRLYCFSCGFTCGLEGVFSEDQIKKIKKEKPEPENIEEKVRYIRSLPKKEIRGLSLHTAEPSSFYVLWSDGSFYKKRINTETGSRYLGPRGHKPPLFWCRPESNSNTLIVTEGELNCLSLYSAIGEFCTMDIVSPGSAYNFKDFIDVYMKYTNVYLILDKDPSGLACGEPVKKMLRSKGIKCTLILVQPDFNDTLQTGGKEAVLKQFKQELGL